MVLSQVAIAILQQDNRFLMQLRDNIPGIVYPGCWGFFGGHLELGESPEVAVRRELQEEIGHVPVQLERFACYAQIHVVRHVFYGILEVPLEQLILGEGADLDLLTEDDIRRGDRISQRVGQVRCLGAPHQQILLDFLRIQTYYQPTKKNIPAPTTNFPDTDFPDTGKKVEAGSV